MFGELPIRGVQIRIVVQRAAHRGRGVVRDDGRWGTAERRERVHVRAQPVRRVLRGGGFGVEVVTEAPSGGL